jgi:hypothetical protein
MNKLHLLLATLATLPLMAVKTSKPARLINISDSSLQFRGDREENGILHRTVGPVRMKIATTAEGKRALANSELAQAAKRYKAEQEKKEVLRRLRHVVIQTKK